ncbi:MAG: hypothetical protein ACPLRP_00385, partial [Candidatus Bipolaricaulaceae bacterium]
MGNRFRAGWLGLVVFVSLLGVAAERSFLFYTEYPTVVISPERDLSLEMVLQNLGPGPETVLLKVDGPSGWNTWFETSSYPTLQIGAVYLLPDPEKKTTIKFRARPLSGAKAGSYTFTLTASTADNKLSQTVSVQVL